MRDALPISFSRPLIPRVNDGSKTQTRRLITPQPPSPEAVSKLCGTDFHLFADHHRPADVFRVAGPAGAVHDLCGQAEWRCPYGSTGSKLWVREDYRIVARDIDRVRVRYEADGAERFAILNEHELALLTARRSPLTKPQPGRFLYRSCSRTTLEVLQVRVERLQDISEEDAKAEGVEPTNGHPIRGAFLGRGPCYREGFAQIWADINGDRANWESNPWVWVVGFRRIRSALDGGE